MRQISARTVFVIAMSVSTARAEPRLFVDLDYQPDADLPGCPSDTDFRALIQGQLGYDPFRSESEQTVVARARVGEHGLQGLVEWRDASGNRHGVRELDSESRDCAALARAMSFAIAVQIQLLADEEAVSASSATPDQERERAAAVAPPARPPKQVRTEGRPTTSGRASSGSPGWEFMMGAGPALGFWITPHTAVQGRVFAGARRRSFALELGAEASLPSSYSTPTGDGFEQQVTLGTVAACGVLRPLAGCIVNKWGRLAVRGFGVDVPHSPSGLVGQVGPRIMLSENLGSRFTGALRVEALATLVPWEVTLDERTVWKTPPVSLSIGFDLAAVFHDNP